VESFLMLTRITDGDGRIGLKRYAANDLVVDSVENCGLMAHQHGVRLAPELLEDDEFIDTVIAGDPELLRTMLDNLVCNAIRFSPRGGTIGIAARRSGSAVTVTVRDDGAGIPENRLSTIFDRMAPASGDNQSGRGHGFGLAIAQGIAELHGGIIAVANRETGGCEFCVTLPVASGSRIVAPA
jgi:signal transduction histidine kinase